MARIETEPFVWPEGLPEWDKFPGQPHPLDLAAEYLQALANALGASDIRLRVSADGRVEIQGEHDVYQLWAIHADVHPEANREGAPLPSQALPKGPRRRPWRPVRRT